jgi:aspartyl-tRNA(Asn)/glutamyl-tRNA(Gln) amidotransferase subunit A
MKANFARVPVWPTSATPTLAHVCPIARTVRDAALLLTAVAGYDPRDPFSIAGPVPDFLGACDATLAGLRIAWSPTLGYARPDKEVVAICENAALLFEHLGCSIELVERVFDEDPADIWTAEFYAGVGTRLRAFVEKQRDLLDPAVAVVLTAALAQDMRDYYEKVFKRYELRDSIRTFFDKYDLLLSPTLPVSSLAVGRDIPEQLPDRNLVSWVYYTYPFNLTGQPAASICAGIASDGMPVGLQIVARRNMETDVIRAASAYERVQSKDYNVRHFNA